MSTVEESFWAHWQCIEYVAYMQFFARWDNVENGIQVSLKVE